MVIVDTTVWVDYLNGVATPETDWLDEQMARQRLGLLDLMVCEVLQGLSTDRDAARVLRHLRRFEIFETGGTELAQDRSHRQQSRGLRIGSGSSSATSSKSLSPVTKASA